MGGHGFLRLHRVTVRKAARQPQVRPQDQRGMIAMIDHTHSPAFVIVSAADIARRAYEMYVERGRAPGFDRDDWLRAERELKNPASSERVFPRDSRRR
jgi:hypothetical protein